jgi:hypothetical protein
MLPAHVQEDVSRIAAFLQSVGITVRFGTLESERLLPGIAIEDGCLIVDLEKLVWPGDLLHEAGHLAVMPAALRSKMNGDLADAPVAPNAGEMEATAWAYAALVAIGLRPEVLFHSGGYHGKSAALIFTFTNGVYPGAAGLAAAGLVAAPEAVRAGEALGYPNMLRWLRA